MKKLLILLLALIPVLALGQRAVDSMRGNFPLTETVKPAPMVNPDNSDVRRVRNYAMPTAA